jgi:hypothetical protein
MARNMREPKVKERGKPITVSKIECNGCGLKFHVRQNDIVRTLREEVASQDCDGLYEAACPNCYTHIEYQ